MSSDHLTLDYLMYIVPVIYGDHKKPAQGSPQMDSFIPTEQKPCCSNFMSLKKNVTCFKLIPVVLIYKYDIMFYWEYYDPTEILGLPF